jgi:hypothetical protein
MRKVPEGRPLRHVECNPARTTKISRGGLVLGNEAKWEYFRVKHEPHHKAERKVRAALRDEFCVTTGCNQKYAIRVLTGLHPEKKQVRRAAGTQAAAWQAGDCGIGRGVGSTGPSWSVPRSWGQACPSSSRTPVRQPRSAAETALVQAGSTLYSQL